MSSQAEFAFQFVSENIEEYEKVLIKKHKILNQVAKKGIGHNSSSYNEVIEERLIMLNKFTDALNDDEYLTTKVRCPYCGGKILYKDRRTVNKIKAQ